MNHQLQNQFPVLSFLIIVFATWLEKAELAVTLHSTKLVEILLPTLRQKIAITFFNEVRFYCPNIKAYQFMAIIHGFLILGIVLGTVHIGLLITERIKNKQPIIYPLIYGVIFVIGTFTSFVLL